MSRLLLMCFCLSIILLIIASCPPRSQVDNSILYYQAGELYYFSYTYGYDRSSWLVGTKAYHSCHVGYSRFGKGTLTCMEDGTWTVSSHIICKSKQITSEFLLFWIINSNFYTITPMNWLWVRDKEKLSINFSHTWPDPVNSSHKTNQMNTIQNSKNTTAPISVLFLCSFWTRSVVVPLFPRRG